MQLQSSNQSTIQSSPCLDIEYKHHVSHTFGHATSTYNSWASVQKECAATLVSLLQNSHYSVPEGLVLEIGCGTGFLTQELVNYLPDHSFHITDISQKMLEKCQQNLFSSHPDQSIQFQPLDGEAFVAGNTRYGAIATGFVAQWFEHPIKSLQNLIAALKPGGILLLSCPTEQSFPEWKQVCQRLGLPFTANPLPNSQHLWQQLTHHSVRYIWTEANMGVTYTNAIAFFRSLKLIGANVNRANQRLSATQMKQLIDDWNQHSSGTIQVHYHVIFLIIQY